MQPMYRIMDQIKLFSIRDSKTLELNRFFRWIFCVSILFVTLTIVLLMRQLLLNESSIKIHTYIQPRTSSMELYNKGINMFKWHNCSTGVKQHRWFNLSLCSPTVFTQQTKPELVLFTTIYYSDKRDYIFNIIIENWALLKPRVFPVLFIADMDLIEYSGWMLQKACDKGWAVVLVPRCLSSGYPLLNSMFEYTLKNFDANWYGYSNGDIIFTDRLWMTLKQLTHRDKHLQNFTFVTSRRYNAYISREMQITSVSDVFKQAKNIALHSNVAIDLFIYHKSAVVLKDMPAFAVGRRGYDNWLVYKAVTGGELSLDITNVSVAVHLAILGLSKWQNSHRMQKTDAEYNMKLPKLRTSSKWFNYGHINCIPYVALEDGKGYAEINDQRLSSDFRFTVKQRSDKNLCSQMLNISLKELLYRNKINSKIN